MYVELSVCVCHCVCECAFMSTCHCQSVLFDGKYTGDGEACLSKVSLDMVLFLSSHHSAEEMS